MVLVNFLHQNRFIRADSVTEILRTRYLLRHPDSGHLFEVEGTRAVRQCLDDGCVDVTMKEEFEKRFRELNNKPVERKKIMKRRETSNPVQEIDQPLQLKYRPKSWGEVIGHDAVIKSLEASFSKSTVPHTYLFIGESGVGKTTLARLLAKQFNCDPVNIIEVDAATTTGVDDMRALTESTSYQGFGEHPNKMYIIDECHFLSKQAWGSLLKATEDTPQHVYFAFCTTDEGKVPPTILTRCQTYYLKSLRYDDIMDLLEDVSEKENLLLAKDGDILRLVAKSCGGSPRQALTMLAAVADCQDIAEAAVLLEAPLESKEIIDLCRAIVAGNVNWKTVQTTIKAMVEQSPESMRIIMVSYLNVCLLNAKSEKEVPRLLDILAAFSKPCNPTDKWAGILLAIGNFVFPL